MSKLYLKQTIILLLGYVISLSSVAESPVPQGRIYDIGTYVTDLAQTEKFYTQVFGLKVLYRWDDMQVSLDGKTSQKVPLKGLYLVGKNGMHLEFLQKAKPELRQVAQEPINHFAIEVENVQTTLELALSLGATEAFPGAPLQYAKVGPLAVVNTQILGLDGERIQILRVLNNKEMQFLGES